MHAKTARITRLGAQWDTAMQLACARAPCSPRQIKGTQVLYRVVPTVAALFFLAASVASLAQSYPAKALALPDVKQRLSEQGAEAAGTTPEEFAAYIRAEIAKYAGIIRKSGAKVE